METKQFFARVLSMAAMTLMGFLISCSDNDTMLQQEAADVAEDAITDYYFEDADDITSIALLSDDGPDSGERMASSRTITIQDPRFNCTGVVATITIDALSTVNTPKGDIVVDFGTGCSDILGNLRKGKILIQFEGRRFYPGSTVVTTFDGYSINDIALSGVRTLTNVSESNALAPKFRIELTNGKAVWPDGASATRTHCFERKWIRAINPLNDAMEVEQCPDRDFAAEGINRRGRNYRMIILEPLVYKRGCPIAVSGAKQFIDKDTGKVVTVDYGDGTCDRVITISMEGNSRTINVSKGG
jgi:hypothetical protein